jgi:PPOX class probable F420-dependent enzyme
MKLDITDPSIVGLLHAASPATVTVMRDDGEPITSPVWFRVTGDRLELVMADGDVKLEHMRRDPSCRVLIFEAAPPFRGVLIRGRAAIRPDEGSLSRRAIASRYLGPQDGRSYADVGRRTPGHVVSLSMSDARAWSLADKLP